jgi:hypothetical protein
MTKSIDFKGETEDAQDIESCAFPPRLMNLHDAAKYLGISYWTLRDYIADGLIPRVNLPCSRRRRKDGVVVRRAGDIEARRIYVDRTDLDALIDRSKNGS